MVFSYSDWFIIALIVAAGIASYILRKLTLTAAIAGILVAILILGGIGKSGVLMLAAFFILGTAVTSYKQDYKLAMRLARPGEGRRTAAQVFANGGIAALLGLLSLLMEDYKHTHEIMLAGSLAAATGDTFSSELGNVHGKNFFNILNFKRDQRGLNGVVSIEGTLLGVLGSAIIAIIYVIMIGWSVDFFAIIIAGLAGNLFDSILGALFERRGRMGNNTVNFLNTAVGALFALWIQLI